jgi:mannonate dehydratase
MKQSWRWYGPNDPVTLSDIVQAGATDIVSALHHIPNGEIWPVAEIEKHKRRIEDAGLKWTVVESLPVHEDIKKRTGDCERLLSNYRQSLKNLSQCGINIVCYNFMPILDWTRTKLDKTLPTGAKALEFNLIELIVFDCFLLNRENSRLDYRSEDIDAAQQLLENLSESDKNRIIDNVIKGLPGSEQGFTLPEFKAILASYNGISSEKLRANLIYFLEAILPTAEQNDVLMCIHPDDPPFSLLGLPRIVSTISDLDSIYNAVPSLNNGLTYCTGSLGIRSDNNLEEMLKRFADRVHFLHLRNTKMDGKGNFFEAEHLGGDTNMFSIIKIIHNEEKRRLEQGRKDWQIPMRPDHGHQMLDDLNKKTNPGYSCIGRLKGLAELRGVEYAIQQMFS